MTWRLAPLDIEAYSLIYADWPWQYRMRAASGYGRAPERHYPTMSTEEICSLPVGALAAPHAIYVIWGIWPRLTDALQVMVSHGFTYCTGFPWVKLDGSGKPIHGTGYRLWGITEYVLIGTRGRPPIGHVVDGLIETAAIYAKRGEHSVKTRRHL